MANDEAVSTQLLDKVVGAGVALFVDAVIAFFAGWAGSIKLESIPDPWPWFVFGVAGVLLALTIRPATDKGRTRSFQIATVVLVVCLIAHGIYHDSDTSTRLLAALDLFIATAMFGSAVHVIGGIKEQYRLWRHNTRAAGQGS